jgi:hypothetical protein
MHPVRQARHRRFELEGELVLGEGLLLQHQAATACPFLAQARLLRGSIRSGVLQELAKRWEPIRRTSQGSLSRSLEADQ